MRIAILTPMRFGTTHHAFAASLALTMRTIKDWDLAWFKTIGCTILPDARSMCLAQALAWGADKIVFIDDDMSWTPPDFRWLCLHKVKACTGVYAQRKTNDTEPTTIAIKFLRGELPKETGANGLVEVESAGFGFIRFDREIFDALRPHTQKMTEGSLSASVNDHFRDWFPYGFSDQGRSVKESAGLDTPYSRTGEDLHFCRRIRQLGFPLWLDPSISLGHHDGAREYRADNLLKKEQ